MWRNQALLYAGTNFRAKVFGKQCNQISVVPWNDETEAKFNNMQMQLHTLVTEELWTYSNDRCKAGDAVVVFDERIKKYMRATIVSVKSSCWRVYLIDTGETLNVNQNELYPLYPKHTTIFEVPPMAFHCLILSIVATADEADSTASASASLLPPTSDQLAMIERGTILRVTTMATAESEYPSQNVLVRLESSN
uniref:Tudor domain-containing protein n=1 Tax=Plectus sambesii TaxID=2011161 RepID=A0A914X855_9BILA